MKKSRLSIVMLSGFFMSLVSFIMLSDARAQEGYIVIERHSKRVLLAANSEQEISTGSFSQIATAKLALDWAQLSGEPLSTMIPVSALGMRAEVSISLPNIWVVVSLAAASGRAPPAQWRSVIDGR